MTKRRYQSLRLPNNTFAANVRRVSKLNFNSESIATNTRVWSHLSVKNVINGSPLKPNSRVIRRHTTVMPAVEKDVITRALNGVNCGNTSLFHTFATNAMSVRRRSQMAIIWVFIKRPFIWTLNTSLSAVMIIAVKVITESQVSRLTWEQRMKRKYLSAHKRDVFSRFSTKRHSKNTSKITRNQIQKRFVLSVHIYDNWFDISIQKRDSKTKTCRRRASEALKLTGLELEDNKLIQLMDSDRRFREQFGQKQ